MSRHAVLALCLLTFALPLFAAEDPIGDRLAAAKAAYETETNRLRTGLLDALQKKEDAARAAGDKKALDALKAEHEAFTTAGELPRSVPTADSVKANRAARTRLVTAYTAAVKEYTKAGDDAKATAVEKEAAEFQTETARGSELIVKGSIWEGTRDRATGKLTLAARGQVSAGKVVIETERKGRVQQVFSGTAEGTAIKGEFKGTTSNGAATSGTFALADRKE